MPDKAGVALEAKLEEVSKDAISVAYSVRNLRSGRIYLFNTLFHTDDRGNRTPDPTLAYVIPSSDHGITIGKFLIPIPPGMKVESADMPYLDPVDAGKTLSGKIRLPLPPRTFNPYNPTETELTLGSKLIVLFGFVDPSRSGPNEALIQPANGAGAGHFNCDYGLGLRYQETLQQDIPLPPASR